MGRRGLKHVGLRDWMLVIVLHSTGQGRIGLNGEPRIAECGSMSFITDPYPTFIKNKK